jgi:hypothetical protein
MDDVPTYGRLADIWTTCRHSTRRVAHGRLADDPLLASCFATIAKRRPMADPQCCGAPWPTRCAAPYGRHCLPAVAYGRHCSHMADIVACHWLLLRLRWVADIGGFIFLKINNSKFTKKKKIKCLPTLSRSAIWPTRAIACCRGCGGPRT